MKITEYAITHKTISYVLTVILIGGGLLAYGQLGRLEFPTFTIKTAVVVTPYPGASAVEVEQEVTDPLEKAVQQLGQIEEVRSLSRPGLSIIYVDIKRTFNSKDIPQIWDELRRKVSDARILWHRAHTGGRPGAVCRFLQDQLPATDCAALCRPPDRDKIGRR